MLTEQATNKLREEEGGIPLDHCVSKPSAFITLPQRKFFKILPHMCENMYDAPLLHRENI